MRILLIEDDPDISGAVRDGLEDQGYYVQVVRDGPRALRVAQQQSHALILLDLMLPGMNGLEIVRTLRQERVTTPILMLTARGDVDDRVAGLEAGADDYLPKPFDFAELVARVRAMLRRDSTIKAGVIKIADMEIDTAARQVTRMGKDIRLTPRELSLLEALAANYGKVLSRDTIQSRVWMDEFSTSNTVEVHLKNLRRKLDDGFETKLIHTIHGIGYSLRVEEPSLEK